MDSFLNVNGIENLELESMELKGYKVLLVMAIGVSALLAFIQCNITGLVKLLISPRVVNLQFLLSF